jgi:DtxR family Mn-dependent transcriptional regulator
MISASMQDYLKAVYELAGFPGQATTSELAVRLDVTPASITGMAKKLADLNLLEHEPYRGVRLTEGGHRIALEMIRHHRLIELYLAEALGVPWDQVHAEAERLEHVLSEDLERRMADALGDPSHDPHGAPIPSVDGRFAPVERTTLLAECGDGARVIVVEVDDSDAALLRFFAEHGIRPRVTLEVVRVEPFGGPVVLRVGDHGCSLGIEAARHVHVRDASDANVGGKA